MEHILVGEESDIFNYKSIKNVLIVKCIFMVNIFRDINVDVTSVLSPLLNLANFIENN
jgi:hypothetical protein